MDDLIARCERTRELAAAHGDKEKCHKLDKLINDLLELKLKQEQRGNK